MGNKMALDIGRDFWCAYRGKWVCESEFNGDQLTPYVHEPKNRQQYIGYSIGKCDCLKCPVSNKTTCNKCSYKEKVDIEQKRWKRCTQCMAQYKIIGKLR